MNSEGERDAKINIAEGIKQAAILEGQGEGSKILQEARGICESLDRISGAIESGSGRGHDALRLKLTEQYIQALNAILSNSKVLMLPPDNGSDASGGWSPQKIATSITLLKSVFGNTGPALMAAS